MKTTSPTHSFILLMILTNLQLYLQIYALRNRNEAIYIRHQAKNKHHYIVQAKRMLNANEVIYTRHKPKNRYYYPVQTKRILDIKVKPHDSKHTGTKTERSIYNRSPYQSHNDPNEMRAVNKRNIPTNNEGYNTLVPIYNQGPRQSYWQNPNTIPVTVRDVVDKQPVTNKQPVVRQNVVGKQNPLLKENPIQEQCALLCAKEEISNIIIKQPNPLDWPRSFHVCASECLDKSVHSLLAKDTIAKIPNSIITDIKKPVYTPANELASRTSNVATMQHQNLKVTNQIDKKLTIDKKANQLLSRTPNIFTVVSKPKSKVTNQIDKMVTVSQKANSPQTIERNLKNLYVASIRSSIEQVCSQYCQRNEPTITSQNKYTALIKRQITGCKDKCRRHYNQHNNNNPKASTEKLTGKQEISKSQLDLAPFTAPNCRRECSILQKNFRVLQTDLNPKVKIEQLNACTKACEYSNMKRNLENMNNAYKLNNAKVGHINKQYSFQQYIPSTFQQIGPGQFKQEDFINSKPTLPTLNVRNYKNMLTYAISQLKSNPKYHDLPNKEIQSATSADVRHKLPSLINMKLSKKEGLSSKSQAGIPNNSNKDIKKDAKLIETNKLISDLKKLVKVPMSVDPKKLIFNLAQGVKSVASNQNQFKKDTQYSTISQKGIAPKYNSNTGIAYKTDIMQNREINAYNHEGSNEIQDTSPITSNFQKSNPTLQTLPSHNVTPNKTAFQTLIEGACARYCIQNKPEVKLHNNDTLLLKRHLTSCKDACKRHYTQHNPYNDMSKTSAENKGGKELDRLNILSTAKKSDATLKNPTVLSSATSNQLNKGIQIHPSEPNLNPLIGNAVSKSSSVDQLSQVKMQTQPGKKETTKPVTTNTITASVSKPADVKPVITNANAATVSKPVVQDSSVQFLCTQYCQRNTPLTGIQGYNTLPQKRQYTDCQASCIKHYTQQLRLQQNMNMLATDDGKETKTWHTGPEQMGQFVPNQMTQAAQTLPTDPINALNTGSVDPANALNIASIRLNRLRQTVPAKLEEEVKMLLAGGKCREACTKLQRNILPCNERINPRVKGETLDVCEAKCQESVKRNLGYMDNKQDPVKAENKKKEGVMYFPQYAKRPLMQNLDMKNYKGMLTSAIQKVKPSPSTIHDDNILPNRKSNAIDLQGNSIAAVSGKKPQGSQPNAINPISTIKPVQKMIRPLSHANISPIHDDDNILSKKSNATDLQGNFIAAVSDKNPQGSQPNAMNSIATIKPVQKMIRPLSQSNIKRPIGTEIPPDKKSFFQTPWQLQALSTWQPAASANRCTAFCTHGAYISLAAMPNPSEWPAPLLDCTTSCMHRNDYILHTCDAACATARGLGETKYFCCMDYCLGHSADRRCL